MALIRWNPGTDIFNLHSELDRVFNEMSELMPPAGRSVERMAFLPLDVKRTERGLEIAASLPGFRPDDVNVTVENGILTIDARHQQEREQNEAEFIRRERYAGRLFRQVYLGEQVDGDTAQASFEDGVLRVTVPVAEKPEPRKIPVAATVQSGSGSDQPKG